MSNILDGIVVLDLTRFFSGPQATLLLAGMGAEVIKIDDPRTGDPTAFAPPYAGPQGVSFDRQTDQDMGLAYLKRSRGKKSVTLNLKSGRGVALFLKMVAKADVVIENFSAGVADRLGIGYTRLREANPRLVYCALSGYGATGPDRNLKAYDPMVQAAVGLMSITGQPDSGPVKAGSPISDAIAGVFAANGIVAALLHRERTGTGQAVDVSMVDCLFSLIFDEPLDCYERLGLNARQGSRIMRFSPFNAYRTLDGWVVIGAATQDDWAALVRVMRRNDLLEHPEFGRLAWRLANNAQVDEIVAAWAGQETTASVIEHLTDAKVPCSPVRSIDDVMHWRHLHDRSMIEPVWNPLSGGEVEAAAAGFPLKFSRTPGGYRNPAPLPGQHTAEVLSRLAKVSQEEMSAFQAAGIV
ncbi:Succinyl-CoA:(R)-benzylsuccinate CoA-transferase subunit BbsF [Variovorax sp. PBS-H4]|uniref:CaiB/BaiF CoA transferase family protein n=1 Tax=Variovorax sp. PBS-H4 TaxID=434008 RepID=UPI00131907C1|nr:CoA transferase [Variovorax sp. PBS-H4]VTU25852.1 Succinyl-CoA:(R)-benzylsuccinate CoA-transferase subunit BbsF [Variovorax sp. PBS-H4]